MLLKTHMSFIKYFIFTQISVTSLDPQETNNLLAVFSDWHYFCNGVYDGISAEFEAEEIVAQFSAALHAWTHSP